MEQQILQLQREMADLRFLLHRKTSGGSADIKGNIKNPSTVAATIADGSITSAMLASAAVIQSKFSYESVNVTVTAGNPSGTGTVTSGSIVIGWYATGNQDQLVDNISISSTTLTITLAANATANNTFTVILLKSA